MKNQSTHATIMAEATPKQIGFRADRALCTLVKNLNRRAAKTLFHESLVRLNGTIASGSERIKAGDRFEFPDPESHPSENLIEKAKAPRLTTPHGRHLTRLYEDADILVVSKPAEIPVYRGQDGFTRRDTLEDVLARAYPPRKAVAAAPGGPIRHAPKDADEDDDAAPAPGAKPLTMQPGFFFVHRLDMETSGCLLIAKNIAARDTLTRDFAARTIHKEYLAVVAGAVSWDEVSSTRPIQYLRGEAPKKWDDEAPPKSARGQKPFYSLMRKQRSVASSSAPKLGQKKGFALPEGSDEGKSAETQFEAIERFRGYSLVKAEPKTGRTHQIRVHLASMGHPLAYDPLYGRTSPYRMREFETPLANTERGEEVVMSRLPLHAWRLGFKHPKTGEKMIIEAPPPRDFKDFIRLMRKFKSGGERTFR